jgi:outer membrane lipoprotein-sorting protein
MRLYSTTVTVFCALIAFRAAAAPPSAKDDLQDLLARMDKAASTFKAMAAQVTYVTHTDVLNEDNTETGTAMMQKVQAGEVIGRVDFVNPDPHIVFFEKRHVQRYFPKIKTLEVWDLEKNGEQLDKFVMIGFGTSGGELAKDYDMAVLGADALKGQPGKFVHVRLNPKSVEAREYVKNLELWIPEEGDPYPVREKILAPSGDYRLVTYSDLKINPPLPADALQLKLPPGVKTVYPGK